VDPLIEARTDAHRRITAAFLGRPEPPGTVRPLVLGCLVATGVAAAQLVRVLW